MKFKLKVKDLEAWMKGERVLFASGDGKRFYVSVHAGPNVERYTVRNMASGFETSFSNRGQAIKFFNALKVYKTDKEQS
jgi:hypothetical protein